MECVFTGLDHLEGDEVIGQGTDVNNVTKEYGPFTVTDGSVTLMTLSPHAHNFVRKAVIGQSARFTVEPMRLDYDTTDGISSGSTARIVSVLVNFLNTYGAKYGKDTDNLQDFMGGSNEFTEGELYTGYLKADHDGGYDAEDHFVISGNNPFPCTVRAMIPQKEITD